MSSEYCMFRFFEGLRNTNKLLSLINDTDLSYRRSHINFTASHVLPVRTFLNRQQIQKNRVKHSLLMCPQSGDSKSENHEDGRRLPVQLSKCKRMVISNRHLRELYGDPQIKKKLAAILIEMTKEEVFSVCSNTNKRGVKGGAFDDDDTQKNDSLNQHTFKDSETLIIPFTNDSWKCQLIICWDDIEFIRDWMCGVERHLGRTNWNKCGKLMLRKISFAEADTSRNKRKEIIELIDSDIEESELSVRDKKNINFEYEKTLLSPITLNVHVHSKN